MNKDDFTAPCTMCSLRNWAALPLGIDVTVMAPRFAQNLFLLSPAFFHWAVLINTNAWYGCEELKSRSILRDVDATNFADRKLKRSSFEC